MCKVFVMNISFHIEILLELITKTNFEREAVGSPETIYCPQGVCLYSIDITKDEESPQTKNIIMEKRETIIKKKS